MKKQKPIVGRGARTLICLSLCTLMALGLTGCGQKGPLVMPSMTAS